MKKILFDVNLIIQQDLMLDSKTKLICAISNGQDSILLLLIFLHLKTKSNLNVLIVYCHHFWNYENFIAFWQLCKIAFILLFFPKKVFVVKINLIFGEKVV